MKVCHLTYDMRIGGTEQVIVNIVEGFHPASKINAVEPQQVVFFTALLCIVHAFGGIGKIGDHPINIPIFNQFGKGTMRRFAMARR